MNNFYMKRTALTVLMLGFAALLGSTAGKMEKEGGSIYREGVWQATAGNLESDEFVVLIDAGHGANDSGKVGINQALEKDINLAIANRLKVYLEAADIKAVCTRPEDDSLYDPLAPNKKMADMKGRIKAAQESHADIAVSIHQNSYQDSSVCGPQLFYYNGSVEGKALAECLQKSFDGVVGAENNRRVPKPNTDYYLLIHMPCPIVIAECGFLSNKEEAALLITPEYQDLIAWNLAQGIIQFINA